MTMESIQDSTEAALRAGIAWYRKLTMVASVTCLAGVSLVVLALPLLQGSLRRVLGVSFVLLAALGAFGAIASLISIWHRHGLLRELQAGLPPEH